MVMADVLSLSASDYVEVLVIKVKVEVETLSLTKIIF